MPRTARDSVERNALRAELFSRQTLGSFRIAVLNRFGHQSCESFESNSPRACIITDSIRRPMSSRRSVYFADS
jgi:hypothetical protein